jgi:hypothetical protein
LRIPIKHIPLEDISAVEVVNGFSPFDCFMGYGWRINPRKQATGYCLGSGDAVKIKTANWSYILVMSDAEDFAEILRQAIRR